MDDVRHPLHLIDASAFRGQMKMAVTLGLPPAFGSNRAKPR